MNGQLQASVEGVPLSVAGCVSSRFGLGPLNKESCMDSMCSGCSQKSAFVPVALRKGTMSEAPTAMQCTGAVSRRRERERDREEKRVSDPPCLAHGCDHGISTDS